MKEFTPLFSASTNPRPNPRQPSTSQAESLPLPPRNPLPQLIPARVRHVRKRIGERLWVERQAVSVQISDEQPLQVGIREASQLVLRPLPEGSHFGRSGDQWTHFWMRLDLPDPTRPGSERFLLWQCQGETTVWCDGEPWAGLDIGHRECLLPNHVKTVWLECCSWQTGIWISMLGNEEIGPQGPRFTMAEVALRDPLAWRCGSDWDVIVQMMEQALRAEGDLKLVPTVGYCRALETASPRLRKLLVELDTLCDLWDSTHDLAKMRDATRDFFARWPAESWQPTAALCGHAHIDLVWLWPESATRKKIVHSMANVLQLMRRYPEMTFTQSMPALYRMLEQDAPSLMAQVREQIAAQRWEVVGAFEVEPDNHLPGGEALARSIIYGQEKIEELTGQKSQIAWIPDVFGYSQCLPQIMALGGVKYFFTIKMTWSKITKFPYTSFIWRGADGTEILSHLGTTDYNGEVLLHMHEQAMAQHRQAGIHGELLLPVGYGDGGGGPAELHLERAQRFANLSGAPQTRWTRADQFFHRLEQVRDRLPVYQGELYLEYHRGTYTTQGEFKYRYRLAEKGLQMHEAARVACQGPPLEATAWLRLLFAHFHDAIPGSSIRDVYLEMNAELQSIAEREWQAAQQELSEACSPDPHAELGYFNSLPYARTAVVGEGDAARQVHLLPIASTPAQPWDAIECPVRVADVRQLAHDRLTARFDDQGQCAELIVDGLPLELARPAEWVLSPDDPAAFDAWDVDHSAARLGSRVGTPVQLRVVESSPVRGVLASDPISIGSASTLRVRYVLEAGSRFLRVELYVDWRERHQLLRWLVPTHYRGRRARFGCPFGAIDRPQLPGIEQDEAMWEVPAARWGAVQHDAGREGLAIIAESKHGFFARDGVLGLSLLRAPTWPDAEADQGEHLIRWAVGPYQAASTPNGYSTSIEADAVFSEPLAIPHVRSNPGWNWQHLGSLNPSWCAPSRTLPHAFFLRLHETAGEGGRARLQCLRRVTRAVLTDFLEQPRCELSIDAHGCLEIPYRPYEIVTLLLVCESHPST